MQRGERSDVGWSSRAQLASTGTDRITVLARIDERPVGIAGRYRDETQPHGSSWCRCGRRRRCVAPGWAFYSSAR